MNRTKQREQAFCLIFQSMFNNDEALAIYEENVEQVGAFAKELYDGVQSNIEELDSLISNNAKGWSVARLPKVNVAILRLAIFEIKFTDVPNGVAINEAVELAKTYSGDGDYAFINGILGAIAGENK